MAEDLVSIVAGYAAVERVYDDAGNLTKLSYYDTEGKLIIPLNKDYASVEFILNANGEAIDMILYDAQGNQIP